MNTLFEHLAQEVKTTYTLEKDPFDIPALPEAQCIVYRMAGPISNPLRASMMAAGVEKLLFAMP